MSIINRAIRKIENNVKTQKITNNLRKRVSPAPTKLLCEMSLEIIDDSIVVFLKLIDTDFTNLVIESDVFLKNKRIGSFQYYDDMFILYINYDQIDQIHSSLHMRYKKKRIDLMDVSNYQVNSRIPRVISRNVYNEKFVALRTNVSQNQTILSVVEAYEGADTNLIKEYLELEKSTQKDNVLFYEKKSLTFGESSSALFDKYYSTNKNYYFILSKSNEMFNVYKEKYGEQLIEKGSKEFYKVLAGTQLLVSSEFPTHLFSDRCIEYEVIDKIFKIPFIFLQHGVMLGKPIENPMANAFWKKNIKFNMLKCVVSSELEKKEFFKVGYNDSDLIKTGLATFDNIDRNANKSKFVYMPTYRSWEEFDVYNGNIEKTTYYQDIVQVINIFESIGVIKDLVLVPHPKFATYLQEKFDDLECQFELSYTNIRDEILVYITDFSSASYDAHFRGANVIYLWNRRSELEKNYKATAPLTDDIADGPCVYSFEELKFELIYSITNNFKTESRYEENFNRIIEFHDGKNSERIFTEINKTLEEINNESK